MEVPNDKMKLYLVAEEVNQYLNHLQLISKIKGEVKGNAAKYSAFSFGKPTMANYVIGEDGTINVDLDFSSATWDYDYDKKIKADVDLSKNPVPDSWKWMRGKQQRSFVNYIDPSMVDYKELSEVLAERYGINMNMTYDKKIYEETKWNGSDGEEIDNRVVYHVIDSHMYMAGRPMNLEEESSFHL